MCYMSPVLLHLGGLMLISHLLPHGGYYFNNLPSPSAFLYGYEQFYYDIEMPAIASPQILPAGSPVSAAAYHRRAKP